jgi:hypothetical protein
MRKSIIIVNDKYDLLKAARATLEDEGGVSIESLKLAAEREKARWRRESIPLWVQMPLPLDPGPESSPRKEGTDST